MKYYIAIEGTDLVFTEKQWQRVKNTYNTTRIVKLGKHKNLEDAHEFYVKKEMYSHTERNV